MAHKVDVFLNFHTRKKYDWYWQHQYLKKIEEKLTVYVKTIHYKSQWWTKSESPWDFPDSINNPREEVIGDIPDFKDIE